MVVVGGDDNGFLIELHHGAGAYPAIRIKAYALAKVQVDHRVDGLHLPKKLQSLDDAVVEFVKLGFAQMFDLNVHGARRRVPVPGAFNSSCGIGRLKDGDASVDVFLSFSPQGMRKNLEPFAKAVIAVALLLRPPGS